MARRNSTNGVLFDKIILLDRTQKLLWFEISKMMVAVLENKLFIIIFGALSFPTNFCLLYLLPVEEFILSKLVPMNGPGPQHWYHTASRQHCMNHIRGGSKKEAADFKRIGYVNKTEKIGGTLTNTNSYRQNDA